MSEGVNYSVEVFNDAALMVFFIKKLERRGALFFDEMELVYGMIKSFLVSKSLLELPT